MPILCSEIMDQIIDHAIRKYPNEACGILRGAKGQTTVSEWIPCKNIYNEMHARDPITYSRDARTAYLIDPQEQQRIFTSTEQAGMEIKTIFHSHTDHDAYFSAEDRLIAAPWGEPMYPHISYLVVSIWDKKFKEANEFYWDDKKKDFVVNKIP